MRILQNLNIPTKPMMDSSLDNVDASMTIEDTCSGGNDPVEDKNPPDERYVLFREMSSGHLTNRNFRPIGCLTTKFSQRP